MLSYFGFMEKLNSFVGNHLLYGQKENISMERYMRQTTKALLRTKLNLPHEDEW